jgi:hypothetical protein
MRFLSAIFALPVLGAVLASPIPSQKQDKRLLGLDLNLGLGGLTAPLDLVGLLDRLTADLVRPSPVS